MTYSFPSNLTCKTELVVVSEDTDFFESILDILLASNSIESEVIVKKWQHATDQTLLKYIGIMVFNERTVQAHDPLDFALTITEAILQGIQSNDSMITTQKILVCKSSDTQIINTFYAMHKIMIPLEDHFIPDVGIWSTVFERKNIPQSFKPSRQYLFLQ